MGLEGAVKAVQEQVRARSRSSSCALGGAQKTCVQLADLEGVLAASHGEILRAAAILASLVYPGAPPLALAPAPAQPTDPVTSAHLPFVGGEVGRSL